MTVLLLRPTGCFPWSCRELGLEGFPKRPLSTNELIFFAIVSRQLYRGEKGQKNTVPVAEYFSSTTPVIIIYEDCYAFLDLLLGKSPTIYTFVKRPHCFLFLFICSFVRVPDIVVSSDVFDNGKETKRCTEDGGGSWRGRGCRWCSCRRSGITFRTPSEETI